MLFDRLCIGLADAVEARKAQLARGAAMFDRLTANCSEDPTGVHRAITALHMYRTIEEIQALERAFARSQVQQPATSPLAARLRVRTAAVRSRRGDHARRDGGHVVEDPCRGLGLMPESTGASRGPLAAFSGSLEVEKRRP